MLVATVIVLSCLALLLWVYVLYPWLMLRLAPADRSAQGAALPVENALPSCEAIVVVRNEHHAIRRRVLNLLQQHPAGIVQRVLVVDDHSTDATASVVAALAAQYPQRVQWLVSEGRGKAAGINTGVAAARAELLLMCDARQVFDRDTAARLVASMSNPRVGLVAGELRYLSERWPAIASGPSEAYWRVERRVRHAESVLGMSCAVSGAIYMLRRALMPALPANLILDDMYVPMSVGQAGYSLAYAREAVAWDRSARSEEHDYLRRRRTLMGNFQLMALQPRWLAFFADKQRFALLSHKLLRLLTPLLLLLILVATLLLLDGPGRTALLALAAASGLLALSAPALASIPVLGKLARFARAGYAYNLAIVAALLAFLAGREAQIWVAPKERAQ